MVVRHAKVFAIFPLPFLDRGGRLMAEGSS